MTVISLIKLMQEMAQNYKQRIFTLRDLVNLSNTSAQSMGMTLLRAKKKGLVWRTRNFWINQMDPPSLEEIALTISSPSYISFESALYHHGLLSQSPRGAITVATTGRNRVVKTPQGTVQGIHLKPPLFFGFDRNQMAEPEKAWLDLLYIRGRKGYQKIISEQFYLERLKESRLEKWEKKFPSWVGNLRQSI